MERTKDQLYTAQEILDILAQFREKLEALGVQRIGLFGSYVRGEATPESDMDFLVRMEKPTLNTYMGTQLLLQDLFRCQIDLVIEEDIKPRLRPYILAEVVYAS